MNNNFGEYKNVYENVNISNEADLRIRMTLENLPKRRKKYVFNIAAAVIIFICACSFLIIPTLQVKAYSIFRTVFGYFVKENNLNSNYDKYAEVINKTVDNNGIKITINSVLSDSLGVTLGYTLKTEKSIKGAYLDITKVFVNGKGVRFINNSGYYKEINNGEYAGYQFLKIKDLPEKFKLEIQVSSIENIEGKWDFKLNTSSAEADRNTLFSNSNFEKVSGNGTLKISKVVSTPLSTYTELTYKSKEPIINKDKIPYPSMIFMDENNRIVNIEDVENTIIDQYTYKTEFYIKEGSVAKLTIIPYKAPEISKEPRKLTDDNEFYNLRSKTPFIINAGDLGSITINSINETNEKVTLNCSTDSIYGDWIINSLGLGYDINLNMEPGISNFNPIYYNKKTMDHLKTLANFHNVLLEFDKEPGLDKSKYTLVFEKYIKNIKIYPELKITVPLK